MTCSKLDDSVINGSGYAATTVRLERTADLYTHDHRLCMHYEHSAVVIIGSCST